MANEFEEMNAWGEPDQNAFEVPISSGRGKNRPVRSGNRRGMAIILIIVAAVIALSAAAIFLIPREQEEESTLEGFAAPTGHMESLDHDVYLLTNELLVMARDDYGRKDLEKKLESLEGAIVGYFSAMRQYQVRFNTESVQALQEKKDQLEQEEGISRVDYNYVLPEFYERAVISQGLPAGRQGTIGMIGAIPGRTKQVFYLSSYAFPALDELCEYLESVHNAEDVRLSEDEISALENGRIVNYAAGSYYEKIEDEFSVNTTTAALRYQLSQEIKAGCGILCVVGQDPLRTNDLYLQEEAEQTKLLLTELEKSNPDFLIMMPYQADGFLYQAIMSSTVGQEHSLFAAPCADTPETALYTISAEKPLYQSTSGLGENAICVCSENGTEAVIRAAIWAERTEGENLAARKDNLKRFSPALAFDDEGVVGAALDDTFTIDDHATGSGLYAKRVEVRDAITGKKIPEAMVSVSLGDIVWTGSTGSGETAVLLNNRQEIGLTAAAEGYQYSNMVVIPPETTTTAVLLHKSPESVGTISGKVQLSGNNANPEIKISMTDLQSGEEFLPRKVEQNYSVSVHPGTYRVTLSAHDCTPVIINEVDVTAAENTELQDVILFRMSDLPGKAEGQVIDSMNGNAVNGADLRFYEGIDAADDGAPVLNIRSDTYGNYSASLPGGMYTVFASSDGYRTSWKTIFVEAETTRANQNCTLTPAVPDGQVRIALAWGATPKDLDSHLVNQTAGIHVFYTQKNHLQGGQTYVALDHDDTDSYGPEQTTIMIQQPGEYTFYVHDYTNRERTNSDRMASSDATVTVYVGNEDPVIFHVPNREGTLWKVFTYRNGVVTPAGEMSYEPNPGNVGR